MIFNNELLFLHLGKTGGTSVSWLLCNTLKPPVFNVHEQNKKGANTVGSEFFIEGKRHANLHEAKEMIENFGMKLSDFKLILVMVRNPLDIELSHYKHLRKNKVIVRARDGEYNNLKNRIKEARGSFEKFASSNVVHFTGTLKDFYTINNKIPKNLTIVKMEEMDKVLPDLLQPFQIQTKLLPHRNKSDEKFDSSSLSQRALKNIYMKYKWIYDQGIYCLPFKKPENKKLQLLKLFGFNK